MRKEKESDMGEYDQLVHLESLILSIHDLYQWVQGPLCHPLLHTPHVKLWHFRHSALESRLIENGGIISRQVEI